MYSIGEFSKITGLTVKTLRFYHERGLLIPALVNETNGYRYYDIRQIDRARMITQLRGLEFTLEQIADLLGSFDNQADMLEFLERQRQVLQQKIRQYRGAMVSLDKLIRDEKEARMTQQNTTFTVEEKSLAPQLIAAVRIKGCYSECGKGFSIIGKNFWRHISGPCFLLHYDNEYKEDDADFEACMPIKKANEVAGVTVRQLPGGRCVCLMHKGPYQEMSRSYAKIMAYIKDKGYEVVMPTRETYIKGPGMIFKGNPKKYLTEIQMVVKG